MVFKRHLKRRIYVLFRKDRNLSFKKLFFHFPAAKNNEKYPDCEHCTFGYSLVHLHHATIASGYDSQLLALRVRSGKWCIQTFFFRIHSHTTSFNTLYIILLEWSEEENRLKFTSQGNRSINFCRQATNQIIMYKC